MLREILQSIKEIIVDYVKSRLFPVTVVVLVLFSILIHQLFVLQIKEGQEHMENFVYKSKKTLTIDSVRGNIFDCNGYLLAYNELSYSVVFSNDTAQTTMAKKLGISENETKNQIVQLETILDRNDISRSVIKDSMSKMAALGQSIGGIFPSDEIVKGSISGYVFEQFEIACYTSLLAAAKNAGDTVSIPIIEAILNEEKQMADWLIQHIPQTTEKFLIRSETDGVEAKK